MKSSDPTSSDLATIEPEPHEFRLAQASGGGDGVTVLSPGTATTDEFDIIVIDGRDRVNCIKNSYRILKDHGIIILDNSERESYKEAIDILLENGFKRIDFYGMYPMTITNGCTTIFFKEDDIIMF